MREWKNGRKEKEKCKEGRRKYNKMCEKKTSKREEEIREAWEARTERKAWEIMRRERGGRKSVEVIREEK